jgi:hypothetical protein
MTTIPNIGTFVVITGCQSKKCLNGRYGIVVLIVPNDKQSSFVHVRLIHDGQEVVVKQSNLVQYNVDLHNMIIREVTYK